ncbi:ELP5 protein, partial [Alcedo cyanopectus]|nr:ELP5 protein [Ceyx cyanopectus]
APPPPPPPKGPPRRVLALLHQDLHPPGLLRALGSLPSTHLTLHGPPHPGPGTPRLVSVFSHPKKLGVTRKDETFTLLPDGSLRCLGVLREGEGEERPPPNRSGGSPTLQGTPLPFRLRLSEAERAARAALPPPYQISPPR